MRRYGRYNWFFLLFFLCTLCFAISGGCGKKDADSPNPAPQTEGGPQTPSPDPTADSPTTGDDYSQTDGVIPLDVDVLEEHGVSAEDAAPEESHPDPASGENVASLPADESAADVSDPSLSATVPESEPKTTPQQAEPDMIDPIKYIDQGGTCWDAIYLGSRHIGYQSTHYSVPTVKNRPVLKVLMRNQINALRLGMPLEIASATQSFETLGGELMTCQTKIQGETSDGTSEIDHIAQVKDEKLLTNTRIGSGEAVESELPWKTGSRTGGPNAIQVSLMKNPIEPQEQRRIFFYDAGNFSLVDAMLTSGEIETVEISGRVMNLRKIDVSLQYQQNTPIPYTLWTDKNGNIIRSVRPFAGEETLVTIRTTRENAKRFENSLSSIDFVQLPLIPLPQVVDDPNQQRTLSFDLRWKNENPENETVEEKTAKGEAAGNETATDADDGEEATFFPVTHFQSVRHVAPNTYRVTVRSAVRIDPATEKFEAISPAKFSQEDLGTNLWILPEDRRTNEIARNTVSDGNSDWEKAVALEKWVFENMTADTSRGLESSAEIAESLKGDPTRYAFLLAALLRSQNIPARVALGYVYTKMNVPDSETPAAMAFHVWNEAMIEGIWIPLDATRGIGGAAADRIKIADSNLETGSFHAMAERLLRTSGNLEIISAEPTGTD